MPDTQNSPEPEPPVLVLGIDTCGPSGSVALGRLHQGELQILGQSELEGRRYSATLVAAVGDLLAAQSLILAASACIVVTSGPGSFTGVRVGLSAAKGFSEGAGVPVIAVSRLEVLAQKAGVQHAALDAHRHEIFLRAEGRELLAGAHDLAAIPIPPTGVAVCDDGAAHLLEQSSPGSRLVRVPPPTAADAIRFALPRMRAGEFADVALLDGHYLRRSDAEIFGEPQAASAQPDER